MRIVLVALAQIIVALKSLEYIVSNKQTTKINKFKSSPMILYHR